MKVDIDNDSGFCFGVVKAIQMAESELEKGKSLYCLGDIVHNKVEVERLESMGIITIGHEEFKKLHNSRVLFRAHGEPPETYEIAKKNNIEIIDATCPVVLNLQKKIRCGFDEISGESGQVVIFGKKGHAESIGLVGQTGGKAIVVEQAEDLDRIDYTKAVYLYSQTTKGKKGYKQFQQEIRKRMVAAQGFENINFVSFETICGQVSNREPRLREFARKFDVILFVSDKESSNGMMLFQVCKEANPRTYFITKKEDLNMEWIKDARSAGICGATSTPKWIMEDVANRLREIHINQKSGKESS
jgi:4-hydroxy-3-methylbut-2-enyl diphosphate reductase